MPNIDQEIVNALQLQRNTALDMVVQLSAKLTVAEARIEQLEATIAEVNKNNEIPDNATS